MLESDPAKLVGEREQEFVMAEMLGAVEPHFLLGEAAVGFGLILGLLTGLTALVGLFLCLNYGLASQWMSFGQQGFHLLLVTSMVIFIGAGAGRAWGLDALLLRRAGPGVERWLRVLA